MILMMKNKMIINFKGFELRVFIYEYFKVSTQRHLLAIHQRFFCALALHDLVQEVSFREVADKFSVNKGLLQNLQQNAATFAGKNGIIFIKKVI